MYRTLTVCCHLVYGTVRNGMDKSDIASIFGTLLRRVEYVYIGWSVFVGKMKMADWMDA